MVAVRVVVGFVQIQDLLLLLERLTPLPLVLEELQAEAPLMGKTATTQSLTLSHLLAVVLEQITYQLAQNPEAMAARAVEPEIMFREQVLEIHLLHLLLKVITVV